MQTPKTIIHLLTVKTSDGEVKTVGAYVSETDAVKALDFMRPFIDKNATFNITKTALYNVASSHFL